MIALRPEQRDIARLAAQSAAASAAALVATLWIGTGEAFLAVISAVLVLQTNRDQTLRSADSRLAGAAIGTIIGGAALALTTGAPVVLVVALAMLIMGALSAWKPQWRYGVVAAAGLAVGSEAAFWETAQNRGIAIAVGVAAGIAAGSLVWPESARHRARRQMAEALSVCRELVSGTLSVALAEGNAETHSLHARFDRAMMAARDTAQSIRFPGKASGETYREAVHAMERLWHAMIILDRVIETKSDSHLPIGPETVAKVEDIRAAACDGLECFERFEQMPRERLEEIEHACRDIWRASRIDPDRENEIQSVALVFGLGEVARNMREIDRAICAIGNAG